MLGNLLEKKLKALEGSVILAVTDDGMAFAGKLVEFDKTTIVLQQVYQGSTSKINWHDAPEEEGTEDTPKKGSKYGFVDWAAITLDELYINIDHVSRIWPWNQQDSSTNRETEVYSRPIYYKNQTKVNRALGMDVPDNLF
ncbi:MAG: hypothetical protein R6U17_10115 [Thermoplasmata archaeon]